MAVDPEEMRKGNPQVMREALEILRSCSKEQLISIRKTMDNWEWHSLLGPEPEGWAEMPKYRKPWMPEGTITKTDYLSTYSILLHVLGIGYK